METEYAVKERIRIYITPEQILKEGLENEPYTREESASEEMNLGSWNNTEWAKWGDFGKFSNIR